MAFCFTASKHGSRLTLRAWDAARAGPGRPYSCSAATALPSRHRSTASQPFLERRPLLSTRLTGDLASSTYTSLQKGFAAHSSDDSGKYKFRKHIPKYDPVRRLLTYKPDLSCLALDARERLLREHPTDIFNSCAEHEMLL
jgi:hypothetical protein